MTNEIVLETIGLGKQYKKRWAVKDMNLQVHRGEVFGFLGPNGAGKSTTIRMVLSLISPTEGTVELFGKPVQSHRGESLSRVGGLVERADFYLYLSARRNLEIVASLMGGLDERSISDVLDVVGLSARANDKVRIFSHGMKQRLGIAQALLGNPEVIILDEPTSGLDPQGIKEVRELIGRLSGERSITVFLSSHLLGEIEQTATSMAIVNQGKMVVQGNVQELLNSGEHTVRVDARPMEKAIAVARLKTYVSGISNGHQYLDVKMPIAHIADLNRSFVEEGVEVHSLVQLSSLEQYFLSITEGASDVTPGNTGR